MRSLRPLLALALLASGPVTLAGVNSWTPTGPDGGFARAMAFDPSGALLTGTPGGIFRSTDNGQSWNLSLDGVGVFAIVFDPTNPNRVMACDPNKLWRSDDGGKTFGATIGPGGSVYKLATGSDGSLYAANFSAKVFRSDSFGAPWTDRSQGLPNEVITDLVVDPRDSNTVYALVQSNGLYRTVNAGVTWTSVAGSPNGSKVAVDPANSANLLLVSNGSIFESRNSGASWTTTAGRFAWIGFYPFAATAGGAVAIAVHGELSYRTDRDSPWQIARMMNVSDVYGVAFDPHDATGRTFMLATSEDPWWTQDSAVTVVPRSHGLRGSFVTSIAAGKDAAGTLYAGYASGPVGLYRRTAQGWVAGNNAELKSRFVSYLSPLAMAVDPSNADVLWVATSSGVVTTVDGGQTWSQPHPGLPNITRALTFDPFDSQILYAGTDTGGSPAPGIYRSVNGGVTWSLSSAGLSTGVGIIAADAVSPGVLYAVPANSTTPPALYKSVDHGVTWTPGDSGLNMNYVNAVAIDPADSRTLYVGGSSVQPGMAKTLDAAQSWQSLGQVPGVPLASSIAIDPLVPSNLFVSRDLATGAVARSVDGGATWESLPVKRLTESLPYQIVLDPLKPSNVIAVDDRYGLLEFEVAPDLEVTLPAAPPVLPLGAGASTTVRVTNHGPLAASAVKLTVTAPPSVTAAPAVSQGSCTKVGASFECALGAVRVDQPLDVQLGLTGGDVTDNGTLSISLSGHESDPQTGNNSLAAAVVTDRVSDVGVTLAGASQGVIAQGLLSLTASVTNRGPNTSSGTVVTFQLGAGLALTAESALTSQGSCAESGGTVTCALGAIPVGALVTAAVSFSATNNGTLSSAVAIGTEGVDPVAENNAAAATIIINPPPSSGGGGGALGVPELLALFAVWLAAVRSRSRIRGAAAHASRADGV